MHHSFDIFIAEKYGVNVAIFLNNVAFWVKKNQANNKHFYDGRYWTYNSSDALSSLFPYWSSDQIDRLIKKCTSLGLLVIDNFNETTYDRTRWYGLTDKSLELFNMTIPQKRGMDTAKTNIPFREIAEPIPYIKPDIKPDNKSSCVSRNSKSKDQAKAKDKSKAPPKKFLPNEAKHDWAAMMNEKAAIERNNAFKRAAAPPELKEMINNMKSKLIIDKEVDRWTNKKGKNGCCP